MRIGITIGDRIRLAYQLPTTGSLERMEFTRRMRTALIGFNSQQMTSYGISTDETTGQLVTTMPDTGTQITIADDLVLIYAEFIREKSILGQIDLRDSEIYASVVAEADRLRAEAEANATIGEVLTSVEKAHRAANLCNEVADAAISKAEELGYEPEQTEGE